MQVPQPIVEAALEHLPPWLPWAGPLTALAIAAAVPAVLLVAVLGPAALHAGRAADAPWFEQARRRWPVVAASGFLVLLGAALMVFVAWHFGGELSALDSRPLAGLAFPTAVLGGLAGVWLATARLPGPPMAGVDRIRGALALWWILLGHALLLLAMFLCMPFEFGPQVAVVLVVGALTLVWWLRGGILLLPRWIGALRPVDDELAARIAAAAAAQGVPGVRGFELAAPTANAFAVLLPRALIVTRALREALDDAQLDAILAHEVAHLGERRGRIAAFSARTLAILPLPLVMPLGGEYGIGYAPLAFVPTLLLLLATRRIPRSFEEHADERGATHQLDEGVYARALEALHRTNLIPAVMGGRRPHPDLYDRMVAAGVEPDYPRPAPPSPWATKGTTLIGILSIASVAVGLTVVKDLYAFRAWSGDANPVVALALDGGDPELASLVAEGFEDAGRGAAASALRRFAAYATGDDPWMALAWASIDAPPADEVHAVAARIETGLARADWRDMWAEVTLAELWLMADELERARAARDRGLAFLEGEGSTAPWLQPILGRLALGLGEDEAARGHLARGLQLRVSEDEEADPQLALELADLADRLGDVESAAALERSVAIEAEAQDRRDELDRLRRELTGRR